MIFDCVILLGYYCLVFTDRWKENCKIKPELVTYLTSLGTVAIFSVLTVIIVLLSSAHPKQECCSGSDSKNCSQPDSVNNSRIEDNPDGIIINQAYGNMDCQVFK